MHFIDTSDIYVFTRRVLAPPLAEAQRYSEIRDRIIFDFYLGLPHMFTNNIPCLQCKLITTGE